ncbi:MAG: hypothetical protein U0531_19465 [Dehalococcoidia bacterium]
MAAITWLDSACARPADPYCRIMRPSEIRYELLEAPVRELVRALNVSGVVETLNSCGGHTESEPSTAAHARSAFVTVHVLDDLRWRAVALAMAAAVRVQPSVSMSISFDHQAEVRFWVPEWAEPRDRRRLLDRALAGATNAVRSWQRPERGRDDAAISATPPASHMPITEVHTP